MKGTITIMADDGVMLNVDMRMKQLSVMESYLIMDALAETFAYDEDQRMSVGALIAVGGIKALSGKDPVALRMDTSFLDLIDKIKEKQNGTVSEN